MRVYMIRYRPTGQFATRSFPKLAAAGNLGRVYGKRGHAQGMITGWANDYRRYKEWDELEDRPDYWKPHHRDPVTGLPWYHLYNPDNWEIVEFDLTEVQSEPDL